MRDDEWIAERVWDIMHSKKHSLKTLFPLVGLGSSEDLRRYLICKNPIQSIVAKIAKAFNITQARLLQNDMPIQHDELDLLLRRDAEPERALILSKKLARIAVGVREKALALRFQGWAHLNLGQVEQAGSCWEQAYKLASEKDSRKRIDEELLFKTLVSLCVYKIERKEYNAAISLLNESKMYFQGDVAKQGLIHQNRALCLYHLNQREAAKSHYWVSYRCFEEVGDTHHLGRVQGNLADLEFHEGNLERSHELLIQARHNAQNDKKSKLIIEKDLARVMILLERVDEAIDIIDEQLRSFRPAHNQELFGKLLLMKSDLVRDPQYAEEIFRLSNVSRELRFCAADLLSILYIENGDKDLALKYHKIMKEFILAGVENYRDGVWF